MSKFGNGVNGIFGNRLPRWEAIRTDTCLQVSSGRYPGILWVMFLNFANLDTLSAVCFAWNDLYRYDGERKQNFQRHPGLGNRDVSIISFNNLFIAARRECTI